MEPGNSEVPIQIEIQMRILKAEGVTESSLCRDLYFSNYPEMWNCEIVLERVSEKEEKEVSINTKVTLMKWDKELGIECPSKEDRL